MTINKTVGEANLYVWFGYGPQKISNTTDNKFQYQLMQIQLIQTTSSKMNDANTKNATPKKNT